jgi:hypothetical protein
MVSNFGIDMTDAEKQLYVSGSEEEMDYVPPLYERPIEEFGFGDLFYEFFRTLDRVLFGY